MAGGLAYSNIELSIRRVIFKEIEKRNYREKEPFEILISTYNKLFDAVSELRHEILLLTIQNEKLRQENLQNGQGTLEGKVTEKSSVLEQKIYSLQEELTNLHRRKGEHAQQIVDLTSKLQETEKNLNLKETLLSEAETKIIALKDEKKQLEISLSETEGGNQVLRDEHQALQIAYASIEEKLKILHYENIALVERLMAYKAHDAEILNKENEHFVKIKQAQMQKELEEAASEVKVVTADRLLFETPLLSSSIPTKVHSKFDAHEGEVNALQFNAAGRMLASGGGDRKIKLWDIGQNTCSLRGSLTGSNAGITSVEFDANGSLILAASNDFATRVWTVEDQRLRHTLTGHSGKVLAARFMGDTSMVVTGSHDRTLKIWDLRSRACIATKFAGSSCNDLVTIDGVQILSGHFDKKIRFWDQRSETSHNEILLQGKVTSLDLSRDRNYLLACVRDDSLVTIDLRMNQKICNSFTDDEFHVACDWNRAAFSSSGEYISVGSTDGTVFIFNTSTTVVEQRLKEHSSAVIAVAWHPSDFALASCDKTKRVVIWTDGGYN
ncbi:autophagy-related protein 16-1 [Daphnia magna]|uniref:autophagy-related protein 16-1 n=1 Tax=Daphnia magna TaxID=35525 RepID=UPI001E1BD36C|nr:autophagy-related protein 16-1 [Daphnia magna]